MLIFSKKCLKRRCKGTNFFDVNMDFDATMKKYAL